MSRDAATPAHALTTPGSPAQWILTVQADDALYIGLMSGTSMDGIDAALVGFQGNTPELLGSTTHVIPSDLRQRLLAVTADTALSEYAELDAEMGDCLADACLALIELTGVSRDKIEAIGSHGQTVWHAPEGAAANSLQIGDPNRIAERTGIPTVADLRRRDIVAGGQGAPLAPGFHEAFFGSDHPTAVVNLGGIANVSCLPGTTGQIITGFDTGPANVLMDTWAQSRFHRRYDAGGAIAASGQINEAWLQRLLEEPYLQREPPKSTGRELFNARWLGQRLAYDEAPEQAQDVMATLCAYTSRTVADAIRRWAPACRHVYLCGGGALNAHLRALLAEHLPGHQIRATSELGLDPEWVEAVGFAWLARERVEGRPANEPGVTGASKRVLLGAIYSGR